MKIIKYGDVKKIGKVFLGEDDKLGIKIGHPTSMKEIMEKREFRAEVIGIAHVEKKDGKNFFCFRIREKEKEYFIPVKRGTIFDSESKRI